MCRRSMARLPHVLLVHFIVVLAPLTALLAIVSSIWAFRKCRRLVWLIVVPRSSHCLDAADHRCGEWLEKRVPRGLVQTHAELRDSMLYFALGLALVAALLVGAAYRDRRGTRPVRWQSIAVAVLAVVVGVATMVQVYRIESPGHARRGRTQWAPAPVDPVK